MDDAEVAGPLMQRLDDQRQPHLNAVWHDSQNLKHALSQSIEHHKAYSWKRQAPAGVKGLMLLPIVMCGVNIQLARPMATPQ